MPEEAAFKIVDLSRIPSAEAGRVGKYDLIATYQDAAGRVRVITIPYEEFVGKDEDEQREILRKYIHLQEAERLRFVGKEITL